MIRVDKWVALSMEKLGWGKSHMVGFQIVKNSDTVTSYPNNDIKYELQVFEYELVIADDVYKDIWEEFKWGARPDPKDAMPIAILLLKHQSRFLGYSYSDLYKMVKEGRYSAAGIKTILPYMEEPQC